VEFHEEEVTISSLKKACNSHFKERLPYGMTCEIVVSESSSCVNFLPAVLRSVLLQNCLILKGLPFLKALEFHQCCDWQSQ